MTRIAALRVAAVSFGTLLVACERHEDAAALEAGADNTTGHAQQDASEQESQRPDVNELRPGAGTVDAATPAPQAEPDSALDAGAGAEPNRQGGSGEVRIAQRASGASAVGSFVRAAAGSESCAVRRVGECSVVSCSPSVIGGAAQLLAPGDVTIAGPSATCMLSEQTAGIPGSCAPAGKFWDEAAGGTLSVSSEGGAFPSFRLELETPATLVVTEPGNFELARDLPFQVRWRGGRDQVELALATDPGCPRAPAQRVRAICSADAARGQLSVGVEVMAALAKQPCLSARVSHTTRQTALIDGYSVAVAAELELPVAFTFATEVSGSCAGDHKPCASYASNEPSSCTRHGCVWQAGACLGVPHPCVLVAQAECSATAPDHGCNVP